MHGQTRSGLWFLTLAPIPLQVLVEDLASNGTQMVGLPHASLDVPLVLCQSAPSPVPHATLSMLWDAVGVLRGVDRRDVVGCVLLRTPTPTTLTHGHTRHAPVHGRVTHATPSTRASTVYEECSIT